jgi:hypothetical protein
MTQKFRLGQKVKTKSGMVGKVIGWGYYPYLGYTEYRVRFPNRAKCLYRKDYELTKVSRRIKA